MLRAKGFTLLEIMLVLVLVSVSAVAVIATLPTSESDQAKSYAQALFQRSQFLNDEALLSGVDYGIRIDERQNRYQLLTFDGQDWQPIDVQSIPTLTELSSDVAIQLNLGGGVWGNDDRLFNPGSLFEESRFADLEEPEKVKPPQLFIVSSGELTPATITIFPANGDAGKDGWRVELKDNGTIHLSAPGESDDA